MACAITTKAPFWALCSVSLLLSFTLFADGTHQLPAEIILIQGKKLFQNKGAQAGQINLQTEATSLLRPGDVLETVPGLVVTQHSGSGKANQYFLRGYNLDHGTDFATSVDGMPVNARSHGHGQGYTDLNFLVPELLGQLDYQKGPGHARAGDFASAGSAQMALVDQVNNQLGLTVGAFGYQRLLAAGTVQLGAGNWLNAAEVQRYDGPWQGISEQVKKYNLWSRYSEDTVDHYLSLTLMAYQNQWNAADQLPARLIATGVSRFYAPNDGSGGESYRYSLSAQWQQADWALSIYALRSRLDLWSDFTYFLQDPMNGDQFYQLDDRKQWGGEFSQQSSRQTSVGTWQQQYGLQLRADQVAPVALAHTNQRQLLADVSRDQIKQWSVAAFSQQQWQFNAAWSAELGLRYDWLNQSVTDLLPAQQALAQPWLELMPGSPLFTSATLTVKPTVTDLAASKLAAKSSQADGIASARTALIYQADQHSFALRYGQGLHSNDARAVQTAPHSAAKDGMAVPIWSRTSHLEFSWQADYGAWQHSFSLWQLKSAAELVYVADAAQTEQKGASRRYGVEGTIDYQWNHQWSTGFELALTKARLTDAAYTIDGPYITGSLPSVLVAKLQYHSHQNLQWQLKLKQLGPRPLDATAEHSANASTQLSMQLSGHWQQINWRLELHNALNSKAADMQYFYASRLAGEAAGEEDVHLHPLEPRMLRINLSHVF